MKNACMKREQIFAFSQGMLPEREESDARAHLEGCGVCRGVLEGYRRLDCVLGEWTPATEPSPWFDARVRAATAAAQSAGSQRGFFGLNVNRWLVTPALAALLVASSVVIFRDSRTRPPALPSQATTANVATVTVAPRASQAGAQELKLYQNLLVLEDYDMLADFDVISALPQGNHRVAD